MQHDIVVDEIISRRAACNIHGIAEPHSWGWNTRLNEANLKITKKILISLAVDRYSQLPVHFKPELRPSHCALKHWAATECDNLVHPRQELS